jgi:hypothetical protein
MRSIRWVWLGPAAFLVHDAEEVLVFAGWLRRHAHELPAPVRLVVFEGLGTRQLASAVAVLLAGYVVAAALGARALARGRRPWPYLLITGAFVGNGLTHLLQAAVFGGYTPGVVTAALVSLPYGWRAGRALLQDAVVPGPLLATLLGVGVALQVPLAWLALQLGRQLAPP